MLAIDLLKAYGLKPKPGAWYFTLSDEPGWITVHPNGEGTKGQPVLLEKRTGEILGGLGGKFNGQHISALPEHGAHEEHGAQALITWYNKTQKGKAPTGGTTAKTPESSHTESPGNLIAAKIASVRAKAKGRFSEADLQEVGKVFVEHGLKNALEQNKKDLDNLESLKNDYKEAWNKYLEYKKQHNGIGNVRTPEYKAYSTAYWKHAEMLYQFKIDSAKRVSESINQIRKISTLDDADIKLGFLKGRMTDAKRSLFSAYKLLPADWVNGYIKRGQLKVKKVDRGCFIAAYGGGLDEIRISGDRDGERLETAIHELGHRLEAMNPEVLKAEKEFYDRRTKGEQLNWLGKGYGYDEKTREDNFLHKYMGKDYNGRAYELVSMGLEMLYTKPHELVKDRDYAQFILGVVALL